jgi:hypothetical protein
MLNHEAEKMLRRGEFFVDNKKPFMDRVGVLTTVSVFAGGNNGGRVHPPLEEIAESVMHDFLAQRYEHISYRDITWFLVT